MTDSIRPVPNDRWCPAGYPATELEDWTEDQATFTLAYGLEKQEKKKTPKGRAKKRLTYTRRFVNVTLTGGKRKMNPNPGAA
ncbi:40s ribosomal protein s30 [Ophiostoma piceae UAMH 11346]|uniref:40s ribosomal protein s30 n=1 Tax=Ophiostoma piceae (strain UAMH 11346) TaxID=1262450 RepID=S3BTS6_OPHP1|nr:40s ribosomal protein s30 [Ophiostoma piceae UAMH 11346]